jgi:hypothetical protein
MLDNICRDIYGTTPDNKLGVTLYMEAMENNNYNGNLKIKGWMLDYNRLKNIRDLRNELSHSRNSITYDICTMEDIEFVKSFKARLLNQTDPLSLLRKQNAPRTSTSSTSSKQPTRPTYSHTAPSKKPTGCFGIAASFLIFVAFIIALLI